MNNAGTLAGTFINAFAINEGAIVHVLSGSMSMRADGALSTTRRSTISEAMAIKFRGAVDPHRRQGVTGSARLDFDDVVNISQRHSTRGKDVLRLLQKGAVTRRRSAPGLGVLRLNASVSSHARRNASGTSIVRFFVKRAFATRRQVARGADTLKLVHLVNLRALAPIYGADRVSFDESAVAVRRVGLPALGRVALNGIATPITRQTIRTSSSIALLATIKMPHYRMTPVEEIRAMRVLNEPRTVEVLPEAPPMRVYYDNREIVVPESGRSIGTPDTEDPA